MLNIRIDCFKNGSFGYPTRIRRSRMMVCNYYGKSTRNPEVILHPKIRLHSRFLDRRTFQHGDLIV